MADRKPRTGAPHLREVPRADETLADRLRVVDIRRRLDDLTRLVSDWVWETDADLKLTFVSARVFEALGYQPVEIEGRPLLDLGDFSAAGLALSKLDERSPFRNAPCTITARNGDVCHFLISALPVFDFETGAFTGFRGTAEDITQRRITEDALNRRDAVLEAVSRAASAFLAAPDWRREMPDIISRLGEASGADRVLMFEATSDPGGESVARPRFGWTVAIGAAAEGESARDLPLRAFGFGGWEKRLRAGEIIAAPVGGLSQGQRLFLAEEGVGTVLVVPIFAGEAWWGFLRIDRADADHEWPEAEIEAVRAAAGIIGGTIFRGHYEQTLRESEARFATAFQTSPDAIAITRLGNGTILEVNDGFTQLAGFPRGSVIGRSIRDLNLWVEPVAQRRFLRGLIHDGEVRDLEATFRTAGGIERVGSLSAKVVEFNGEQCILSVTRDVTLRKHADEAIRKLSQAVEQSPVLVMITDTSGVIEYVNPKFVEITGYAPEDITARRFYEERLRHQTYHDSLTDLPNRTLFFDRLPRALARARRDGRALTLMFIDLDHFRFVNEGIGHEGGDEVLRQVA